MYKHWVPGTGQKCSKRDQINALPALPGVWWLCKSSIIHSVHQLWCCEDPHIGQRQVFRLGYERELWPYEIKWPCRRETVAFLVGSIPMSPYICRSITMQVSKELVVKHLSQLGDLETQHSSVVFLGINPLFWGPGLSVLSSLGKHSNLHQFLHSPPQTTVTSRHMEGSIHQRHPCL